MNVLVQISLTTEDEIASSKSLDGVAVAVLQAVGGDPEKDTCTVTISGTSTSAPPPPDVLEPLPA